jgi:hypothetical protein
VIVNAHISDGRTVFQFASRGDLQQALRREVGSEERTFPTWVRWDLDGGWRPVRLSSLRRQSVAFVVSAMDSAESDDQLPAKEEAQRRLDRHREREAEGQAAA